MPISLIAILKCFRSFKNLLKPEEKWDIWIVITVKRIEPIIKINFQREHTNWDIITNEFFQTFKEDKQNLLESLREQKKKELWLWYHT